VTLFQKRLLGEIPPVQSRNPPALAGCDAPHREREVILAPALRGVSSPDQRAPAGPVPERVLIAGAAGFIGTNLVRELLRRGITVHALVRPTTSLAPLEDLIGRVVVHRVDATDLEALRRCVGSARPIAVVNALRASRRESGSLAHVRDNVLAAANLVEAAAEAGCEQLVQLGSSTEHSAVPGPLDESVPLRPQTLHGASKAAATLICHQLARERGIRFVLLRPFQVYGPWDHPRHLVPRAIGAALDGRELAIAPRSRRDWVYVGDVVNACVLALAAPLDGEEINIGTATQWTNEEVVAAVSEVTGRTVRVRLDEGAHRPWDRASWVAEIAKARSVLGWEPRHDLRAGIEATVAWELSRRRGHERRERPALSVVVPVYRNADTLRELHSRMSEALDGVARSREIVYVNDGCDEGSGELLSEIAVSDRSVAVLDNATNLGQHEAVLKGLERSRGAWTVVLDADLQDPPEAIAELLTAATPGVEAVFAGRRGAYESPLRLLTGRVHRALLRVAAGSPADAGMFVALSRRMVERLREMRRLMPRRSPHVVAMIGCSGLPAVSVPVERSRRPGGGSAYSSWGRVRAALRAISWAAAWRLGRRS